MVIIREFGVGCSFLFGGVDVMGGRTRGGEGGNDNQTFISLIILSGPPLSPFFPHYTHTRTHKH